MNYETEIEEDCDNSDDDSYWKDEIGGGGLGTGAGALASLLLGLVSNTVFLRGNEINKHKGSFHLCLPPIFG